MENKVGHDVPPAETFAEYAARLVDLIGQIKAFGVQLSKADRTHLSHPRHGSDPQVQTVIRLARSYGIDLAEVPVAGVEADYNLAHLLPPVVQQTSVLDQLVLDTQGQAESEYWQGFLVYYGILTEMAKRIPALEVELKPVKDFMARRRTPPTPPASGGE